MSYGLVVVFWDSVRLDEEGHLASAASFVQVLEELRRQTPVLLLCGGVGEPSSGHGIRIVPVGVHPSFASFLLRPWRFTRQIRQAVGEELGLVSFETPVLLVDATLASGVLMPALSGRRVFLYVRGDDVREARLRQVGLTWPAGMAHSLVLSRVRRALLARFPVVGAGRRPLPGDILAAKDVWPFFPSTLSAAPSPGQGVPDLSGDPLRIVWVGRMARIKRVDRLLSASSRFARIGGRQVRLDLYGDGPSRATLEKQARETVDSLQVVFHGQVPNQEIVAALQGALCLALTSEWEGFPKVVPEALSAGLPVVSFNVGSVSGLIEEAHVGVVVDSEDDMAQAFERLASTPEYWKELAANASRAAAGLVLGTQCRALLKHLGVGE